MSGSKGKGFAELFAESEQQKSTERRKPRVGEEVRARVVAIAGDSVFVDVGGKSEGMIERHELVGDDGELTVAVGDEITATVVDLRNDNVVLRTRLRGGDGPGALEQAFQHGIPVVGKVTGVNKGGVEVEISGQRAFCPLSQLDTSRVEDPSVFVGQELSFRITKLETGRDRSDVVVSRRALLEAERAQQAAETRARLEVGAEVTGTVTRIKPFGAFVDIGGLEGLLHVSELDYGRVGHPKDILSEGETVRVRVTAIETSKEPGKPDRISLSRKALAADPWETTAATLAAGSRVRGKVVKLESYGVFVEIAAGLEGLVHVSELSERRIGHPREVVAVGDTIEAVVVGVDPERRRIALSVKGIAAQNEKDQAAGYRGASGSLGTFGDLLKNKLGR